jgi:sugar (pentulose or hexulose) kinase
LTLANFVRTQVFSAFGTLSIGMRVLTDEGVELDAMYAHGGLFRTAGVAQRLLAAAVGAPVTVGTTAGEGGAWGIAVLAAYLEAAREQDLSSFLSTRVFGDADTVTQAPDASDVRGFDAFLERYTAGLAIERAAVDAV